jgi:hypothetical protein
MEKQFCTYEISLKLKEIGFDEKCFGWFNENNSFCLHKNPYAFYTKNSQIKWNRNFFKRMKYQLCAAPLRQQAIDWCFEQLDFYYPTLRLTVYSDESGEWLQTKDDGVDRVSIDFDNKEEMVLKAIELIKKNKL